jgi:hypothetical protein
VVGLKFGRGAANVGRVNNPRIEAEVFRSTQSSDTLITAGVLDSIDIFPGQAGVCQSFRGTCGFDLHGAHMWVHPQGVFIEPNNGGFSPLWHT